MFDPKQLLDSFLGAGAQGRNPRTGQGDAGRSGGGFLGDIVSTLGGSEGVRQTAGRAVEMARRNPIAAGTILAGVFGTGMGRGLAGSALKYGGLAAIASMAYKAYQDHQAGQQPARTPAAGMPELQPPPADTAFDPGAAPQGSDQFALTLIRAMIAAAKADGTIDEEERNRIGDRARLAGMDAEAEAWLKSEFAKPVDLEGLVSQAETEAQRVELYTAARLAINPNKRAERGFLDQLAGRLGLEDALVDHIEATVASAAA